ncbi:MAG: alanyl-tRNA editing protein, partial [Clostridia bacterium]|nr:alanyl-tRNA editing protein [Clostridia bacterium]
AYSNIAVKKTGGILVLLSGIDGNYKYVISSDTVNLRDMVSDINKSLLGRGGGKPNMIQGAFSSTAEEIKRYFNP